MPELNNYYSIRQISNGYLVTIYEDTKIETCDPDYGEAISRLITHLVNMLNQLHTEEKK